MSLPLSAKQIVDMRISKFQLYYILFFVKYSSFLYLEHLTDQAPHIFDYIEYIKAITGGEFLKESNAQPCNNNITHTKEIKKKKTIKTTLTKRNKLFPTRKVISSVSHYIQQHYQNVDPFLLSQLSSCETGSATAPRSVLTFDSIIIV